MNQTESKPKRVTIKSFDPLEVSFPNEPLTGPIHLILPPAHIKVWDLSMGGALPGAHIGADVEGPCLTLTAEEGFEWSRADMIEFITQAQDEIKGIWLLYQEELDKRFLLDREQAK